MKKVSYKLQWGSLILEMLPSRALFIPSTKELFISDIHLGKAEYFQQNGIPLTNNSDDYNLARIKTIVKKHNPKKLIILGDLFHSRHSISNNLRNKVKILPKMLNTKIQLVIGNHDIGCKVENIKLLDFIKTKNLIFSHEPINYLEKNTLNICGHYHPKLYLSDSKDKLSFRCFAMDTNKNILYLPAFGDLTGGHLCKKSFKKWAIISEKEILEI